MKKSHLALAITNLLVLNAHASTENSMQSSPSIVADETIVVTANRTAQQKFDVLAAIDVFDRDAIEKIQPLSVSDLLGRVAGISITTQGTQAHTTSMFVRGSNSNHVLILVNGVRVGSATLGNKDVAAIPVQLIERVEVVRGPRAALWGADAMGGVVQIFTREFSSSEGQVGVKIGNNNLWQGYGAIGFGNETHQYTLSVSAEASDGFDIIVPDADNIFAVDQADDDGFNRESIALTGKSAFTDFYSLEVNALFNQGTTEFDTNTLYGGDETDHENYHVLLRNHFQLEQAYFQLSLSTSQDSSEDNYSNYVAFGNNLFETNRDQVSGFVQLPIADKTDVVAGADWYEEEVVSNNAYDENKRDAQAYYLTGRHEIEKVKMEASVRYDEVGDVDSETTYQVGLGYQVSDNLLIALTNGTAFKAPSFNDLFYPYSGNPNLRSETADSTEILMRFQAPTYSIEVSLYKTEYDDLIEWAPVDPNDPFSPWLPDNIAQATVKGAEATISAELMGTLNQLTLSHIDAENGTTGQQLARRPYFSGNYNLTYPGNHWDVSLDVNHQGGRSDTNGKSLPSYTLLDIGATYELSNDVTLLAKVTNITDKAYEQVSEYPGAERGFSLGVDYRF